MGRMPDDGGTRRAVSSAIALAAEEGLAKAEVCFARDFIRCLPRSLFALFVPFRGY
jgi:hypothetical protein